MAEPYTPAFSFFPYALSSVAGSHRRLLSAHAGGTVFSASGKVFAVFRGTSSCFFVGNDFEESTEYHPAL